MSKNDNATLAHDIDWTMLEKKRYIPLSLLSTFTVRSLLYPFTLVRTRLQVQVQSSIYRGTWHALTSTVRYEGFRALYKGFLVYNCQLAPGLIYITTFEATRSHAHVVTENEYFRAGIGGALGSFMAQIFACPIDIITQHMQLAGLKAPVNEQRVKASGPSVSKTKINRIHIPMEHRHTNYSIFKYICKTILYDQSSTPKDQTKTNRWNLKGFYRGYFVSTFVFSLTSAIWWPSYYFYQRQLLRIQTTFQDVFHVPLLLTQCISGSIASLTSTTLTNPLDVCRTRVQVEQKRRKVFQIVKELWCEERWRVFSKGLTARLSHSCCYSFFIIFGYETVKRISLKEEHQGLVKW